MRSSPLPDPQAAWSTVDMSLAWLVLLSACSAGLQIIAQRPADGVDLLHMSMLAKRSAAAGREEEQGPASTQVCLKHVFCLHLHCCERSAQLQVGNQHRDPPAHCGKIWLAGCWCGGHTCCWPNVLFVPVSLQQAGLQYTMCLQSGRAARPAQARHDSKPPGAWRRATGPLC